MSKAIRYKPKPKEQPKTNAGRPLDLKAKQTTNAKRMDYWNPYRK